MADRPNEYLGMGRIIMRGESIVTSVRTDVSAVYEYRAVVVHDEEPGDSPREWENVASLALAHGRYDLPWEDETPGERVREACERGGWRLAARYVSAVHDAVVVPVWGYEHGQLTIHGGDRIGQYADEWDSGQCGLAWLTRDRAREELPVGEGEALDDVAERCIGQEIDTYDAWLRGEVYGWTAERRRLDWAEDDVDQGDDGDGWEHIDSCFGYVGWSETDHCLAEAKAACEAQRAEDDEAEAARLAEIAADEEEIADLMRCELGVTAA